MSSKSSQVSLELPGTKNNLYLHISVREKSLVVLCTLSPNQTQSNHNLSSVKSKPPASFLNMGAFAHAIPSSSPSQPLLSGSSGGEVRSTLLRATGSDCDEAAVRLATILARRVNKPVFIAFNINSARNGSLENMIDNGGWGMPKSGDQLEAALEGEKLLIQAVLQVVETS